MGEVYCLENGGNLITSEKKLQGFVCWKITIVGDANTRHYLTNAAYAFKNVLDSE